MKIGFVFDDTLDTTDGIQQYLLTVGPWLIQQGHEVHYLVGETTRSDVPQVHSLSRNIKVRFNGNRMSIPLPARRKALKILLEREQFDVLHVQMPYSPFLAGRIIAAAPAHTAIVGTFHVAPFSRSATVGSRLLAIWCRRTLDRFAAVISVSSAAAEFAERTYGLQTVIIPNVMDYVRFHDAHPLPQYDDDVTTVLFLGRLVARKGCQQLLEAVASLPMEEIPPFRVVICGGGPLDSSLNQYVIDHNLGKIVEFVGRVSEADKPRYFASADCAVFPSSGGESFGIVLIEAMASGHALVLGGNNPGYRSVLGGRPAQLFSTATPQALMAKLRPALLEPLARQAGAAWGMKEAARYDIASVGPQLIQLYETVVKNGSKPHNTAI